MHAIPTPIATWKAPGTAPDEAYSVFRTAQGRIAVRRGTENVGMVVVDTVDELPAHVPEELRSLVADRMAGAARA